MSLPADALATVLEPALGPVTIDGLTRLSAGANRETWSFDALDSTGLRHELILQRDREGMDRLIGSCAREARVLRHARAGGVPCAEVVVSLDPPNPLERSFTINRRLAGETIARRILRDPEWAEARAAFVGDCARALGAIHRLDPAPARDDLPELPDALELTRLTYDELADPHPVFELAMRWLERNRPEPLGTTVVHGDFRLGNLLLDHSGLAAALDWEIAHIGDPGADLGWLCVRAWRFSGTGPVGGIGSYAELLEAYEAATGVAIGLDRLRWWEIYGTLRWGVICMQLTSDHRSGRSRSVELATIGRRVVENEYDVLLALREVTQ